MHMSSEYKTPPYKRYKNDPEAGIRDYDEGDDEGSGPFDIVRTKSAPVDRLRRWRQAALVLNASRRFRYTLDLKKEEERKQLIAKIRMHAQVIRAAVLFQADGQGLNVLQMQPTPAEKEVAECLIMLARSGGGLCLSSPSSAANSTSHFPSNEEKKFTTTDDGPAAASTVFDIKKPQEPSYSANPATIAAASFPATASAEENQPIATAAAVLDVKNLQQEYPPATPQPSAQRNSFPCNVCGKVLPSHQALGGHKTSHRARPLTIVPSDGCSPCTGNPTASKRVPAVNPSHRLHECNICHMVFPTGQALGGHKRKHYEGIIKGRAPKGCPTSSNVGHEPINGVTSNGVASHASVAVCRNFDLNLPPPDDGKRL